MSTDDPQPTTKAGREVVADIGPYLRDRGMSVDDAKAVERHVRLGIIRAEKEAGKHRGR